MEKRSHEGKRELVRRSICLVQPTVRGNDEKIRVEPGDVLVVTAHKELNTEQVEVIIDRSEHDVKVMDTDSVDVTKGRHFALLPSPLFLVYRGVQVCTWTDTRGVVIDTFIEPEMLTMNGEPLMLSDVYMSGLEPDGTWRFEVERFDWMCDENVTRRIEIALL